MNTALLHFVWQGPVIAFLLAVALMRVKSARARYGLACAALVAMPAAFALTYALSLPAEPRPVRFPVTFFTPPSFPGENAPLPTTWSLDPASLWMAGMGLLYAYRLLGWLAAQRLRRVGVCAAPAEWQQRLSVLNARLRTTKPVVLLESALAVTPMAIGLWRPVILVPLGLLAGIPAAQVEALLLHELAHIRRHDYLVNLLQAVVEGLLFYHPAVWWVSHIIRREREMCCDDLAAAATGDVLIYTRALAAIELHRVRVPILAATGGSLMHRIHRLLGRPSRVSPAPALVFFALAAGAALYAFEPVPVPLPDPIPAPAPEPAPSPQVAPQPVPPPQRPPQPESIRRPTPSEMLAPATATPYERWRTQEVIWIINPEEFAAFGRLRTDEERQMFIEQFWLRRDPTPATQSNEFKEEHYRRIAWANDRFAYPGWDGWMSDRGMIYIKFGPPDEKEEHAADPSSYSYEKWRYRYLEGIGNDQTVAFVDQKGDGAYRLSIETDKKLAILGELGGPGRAIEVLKSISDRADVLFK